MTERGWIQGFVRVNSSCVRLNSTVGWEGGIYFFNLGIGEAVTPGVDKFGFFWYNALAKFCNNFVTICNKVVIN